MAPKAIFIFYTLWSTSWKDLKNKVEQNKRFINGAAHPQSSCCLSVAKAQQVATARGSTKKEQNEYSCSMPEVIVDAKSHSVVQPHPSCLVDWGRPNLCPRSVPAWWLSLGVIDLLSPLPECDMMCLHKSETKYNDRVYPPVFRSGGWPKFARRRRNPVEEAKVLKGLRNFAFVRDFSQSSGATSRSIWSEGLRFSLPNLHTIYMVLLFHFIPPYNHMFA